MKQLAWFVLVVLWGLLPVTAARAATIALELVPSAPTVTSGDTLDVDVLVSGTVAGAPPSIGAFDLDVRFDPAVLSATTVAFDSLLGNLGLFEALTDFTILSGLVTLAEVSLVPAADLDLHQPDSFRLARLSFDAIASGPVALSFGQIRVDDSFGGKLLIVPWANTVVLLGSALSGLLACRRRAGRSLGRRTAIALVACGATISIPWPLAAEELQFKDLVDPKTKQATAISYAFGLTEMVSSDPDDKFFGKGPCPHPPDKKGPTGSIGLPCNLKSSVFVTNKGIAEQSMIICLTGVTEELSDQAKFKHLQINMKVDQKKFTCEIPVEQNLPPSKRRNGSMGCQLVTVPACASKEVVFTSGNARTIPKVEQGKIVAGQFERVGPPQKGELGGSTIETGRPIFGLVGGHPSFDRVNNKRLNSEIFGDTLLDFILLDDAALDLASDPAAFDCNKCFGMMPDIQNVKNGKAVVVMQAHGYFLKLPDDAALRDLNVKVIKEEVKYKKIELKKGEKSHGRMNLYNDTTYFGSGGRSIPAIFEVTTVDLPSGCALTDVSPLEDEPFQLARGEQKTGTFEVSCDSTLEPGALGQLVFTLLRTDTDEPEILAQHWVRLITALPCDVNEDGIVDVDDIDRIFLLRGAKAQPGDPHNVDNDRLITVNDARACTLRCADPQCAPGTSPPLVCQ